MAEPLKNLFGSGIALKIGEMVGRVSPAFDQASFVKDALEGYENLELMPRGWKIAESLYRFLPQDYEKAVRILVASLGPQLEGTEGSGMSPFLYLPHVFFVSKYGLDHFEASMEAQYELTQRFTAEFSIRPFLEKHTEATLDRLKLWAGDPSPHVRRLVSEGTRPRLPWAPRLRGFQKDPAPVLELLEMLKDDPELYVRRSVANNLNDIGKDHPLLLAETARRWLGGASENRRWLVRHALRSAVKRGEGEVLKVLGLEAEAQVRVDSAGFTPPDPRVGGAVLVAFELTNTDTRPQRVLVDFRIHFIKASGRTSPKVFKLKTLELQPGERVSFRKSVSLKEMTTRKHYPGTHGVEVLVNGRPVPLGAFELKV